MSVRLLATLTLLLTICGTSVLAQEQGGRGQRGQGRGQGGPGGPGGPGGFGGGFGMMSMRGANGAAAVLRMLDMADVRKEVGVTDEVYESVNSSTSELREKMRSRELTDEQRQKLFEEFNAKAGEIMEEVLVPARQKRLMGLYAQTAQARAVLNTMIAKEVGVSEEQRESIEKELGEMMQKAMAEFRPGGAGERPDFAKIQESMAKLQEDAMKLVDGKLTADQRKALEDLKGEKFEFQRPQFGGFGGGRGGDRGERGGDRGGRGDRNRGDGN